MAKVDDNFFPKVIYDMQTSDPAAPSDRSWKLYSKAGGLYARSSNAIVGPLAAAAGSSFVSGEVSYTEFTSSVNVTATTEAGANTIVTAPSLTGDGSTAYMFEFMAEGVNGPSSSTITTNFFLFDGSTSLGYWAYYQNLSTGTDVKPLHITKRIVVSNAAHTYSVRASVSSSGTAVVTAGVGGAGANTPGFLRVYKA